MSLWLQVICAFCNNCRDLDLCRDAYISYDETSNRYEGKTSLMSHSHSHLISTPISCPIPIPPHVPFPLSHSISHPQYLCLSFTIVLISSHSHSPIPSHVSFPLSHPISCLIPRPLWCCSHCNNPYNRDHIEQSLIDAVQRRSMSVVLQDLVCTKCQGVRQTCRYTQGFV